MRRTGSIALAAATLAAGTLTATVAPRAVGDGPPAGATALCRDGTYSFSATHSGSCSHHGGVAQWLDATGSKPPAHVSGTGRTVLLAPRSRTARCTLRADPDRRCSPGAYSRGLTKAVLCSPSFRTSTIRNVPESEKHQVEAEYGLAPRGYGRTLEVDHIVSLELGGSNDIANLFPERSSPAPGYRAKDRLENEAHRRVCAGAIGLRAAQRAISTNWESFYRRVFGVRP